MPLWIQAPRPGRTPYYSIRGTYLGISLDRSTKTSKRADAKALLKKIKLEIERGTYARTVRGELTFAEAAISYMNAGGERRHLKPLLKHFGTAGLSSFTQEIIDEAAIALYPKATPGTRNRQVYTPVCAILRRAGRRLDLKRPKGASGAKTTAWLWPEQMERLLEEARALNPNFEALLITLCCTGMRLSEALRLRWDQVRLSESFAYIPTTKNEDPRSVFLPPSAVTAMERIERKSPRVFGFTKSGYIYNLLKASAARAGITLPPRSKFHILRHTYATWMRRYGGADKRALLATGAWRDGKSVDRYTHAVIDEEAKRALLLPMPATRVKRVEKIEGEK